MCLFFLCWRGRRSVLFLLRHEWLGRRGLKVLGTGKAPSDGGVSEEGTAGFQNRSQCTALNPLSALRYFKALNEATLRGARSADSFLSLLRFGGVVRV